MKNHNLKDFLITLIMNGFHISSVNKITPNSTIVDAIKHDTFGASIRYSFLHSNEKITPQIEQNVEINAAGLGSTPVFINDNYHSATYKHHKIIDFYKLMGGIVNTGLILVRNIEEILQDLGMNKLPQDLQGNPDELLETYVKEVLQYLLDSPARRYGSDRLFESVPDGLLIGRNNTPLLFDAKAYEHGYKFSADDIKRFASYVNDFNCRYETTLGKIFSFIVVSGEFKDSVDSINGRAENLYKLCRTNLSCISSKELGAIVNLVRDNHSRRNSVDWKDIFSKRVITVDLVKKELERSVKDL